jgi:hypothetical protein
MRDLTFTDIDAETAEQLPARELMGGCPQRSGNHYSAAGNNNGSFIPILSGNQVQVNLLAAGNSNGNYAG